MPEDSSSVILDTMCIPAIDGQGYLHVDEDVANLVIVIIDQDGQTLALYDAATEIEDVAAPGTGAFTAPSANNIRVSPQGNTGGDCTEMQVSDGVWGAGGQDWVTITVSDGQTTIMDFTRLLFLREGQVRAIDNDVITAGAMAANAIGNSELGTDAISAAKIAAGAIGNSEIAAGAIGSSELGTGAIDADSIAANAITAAKIATDAITADELSAAAIDEIWDEMAEDQGSVYSAREVLSLLLSEAIGTCVYTQGTRTWVCKDPSNTETRFTLVYGTELDGDRSTSTPAPVTP
jgi:hypothetical protein